MYRIGPFELIILFGLLAVSVIVLGITIWGIVDAAKRPEQQWAKAAPAGHSGLP